MSTLLNQWKIKKVGTKIVLRSILALTACGATLASEGFYFGAGVGKSFMYGEVKNSMPMEHAKLRKRGYLGSAFVGYNHLIKDTPMIIGLEVSFQNHAMKKKINGTAPYRYTLSVSTNNSIMGHIKLGFNVNNISFYCKGGIAQTNFKSLYIAMEKEKQTKPKKIGSSVGIGVEAKLNDNFSMGIEHLYNQYSYLSGIAPDFGIPNSKVRFKPETHTTSLRLVYNF
jgi:opacity protein-like surface antigen